MDRQDRVESTGVGRYIIWSEVFQEPKDSIIRAFISSKTSLVIDEKWTDKIVSRRRGWVGMVKGFSRTKGFKAVPFPKLQASRYRVGRDGWT